MEIYTTSQARANLFKIIDHTVKYHEATYIIGKRGKAVLIPEEDYRALMETLHITSVPGLKDSILKASAEPIETFAEDIDWDDL